MESQAKMTTNIVPCKICGNIANEFASTKLLKKYDVAYFKCELCGFVQTESPYWLEEAYSKAITQSDIGLVSRNIYTARLTQSLILAFYDFNQKFLDYGGGYGLFVRLLRDRGLDFYRYDIFCENVFARGFDVEDSAQGNYELVTAFEVFEHLVDPLAEIKKMLCYSSNIFFSTTLLPTHNLLPNEWWYYGTEHGQHIALYTKQSLEFIAAKFGLRLYTDGKNFHLLTKKHFPFWFFRLALNLKVAWLISLSRRKSLLGADFEKLIGRTLD